MGSQAKISRVGLVDAYINVASIDDHSHAGALVGYNKGGVISNSYARGIVFSSASTGSSNGGGLVGYNTGLIINSYGSGALSSFSSSYGAYGGGLVGANNAGTIRNSYGVGTVSVRTTSTSFLAPPTNASMGGGLVGYNSGTISNSYATGAVSSSSASTVSYGGGLVGYIGSGGIDNSYATGMVVSSTSYYSGGLVGYNLFGKINGVNYFVHDLGTHGIGTGQCSENCTLKLLEELQALTSTEVTWSTDNWEFGESTELPRLKYAEIDYCTDDTHTAQDTCEAASESWITIGCGVGTGVTCGDIIPEQ